MLMVNHINPVQSSSLCSLDFKPISGIVFAIYTLRQCRQYVLSVSSVRVTYIYKYILQYCMHIYFFSTLSCIVVGLTNMQE